MKKQDLVRVFVKGGIISPGDFLKIINTANFLGAEFLHFGSRQDILFPAKQTNEAILKETFNSIQTEYDINIESQQNIVSSYVALDVMPSNKWLAHHIYHYILDTFDYRPKLKINIVDPAQSLVPLFTGQINFIASESDNYWYLYLHFDKISPTPWCFPELIYGFDLAKIAKELEKLDLGNQNTTYLKLYDKLTKTIKINTSPIKNELNYTKENFPYYEGINKMSEDKYWLGVYWRNNQFDTKFLKKLCEKCIETNVGKISLTPWKSFIVKGIHEKDRLGWEKLLGINGINMRHSSLELNWHLPMLNQESLNLKNYLVRQLDQMDISTQGLTFTVKPSGDMILFTSVVIEINEVIDPDTPKTFNILYSKNFNPNLSEYYSFAKGVTKEIIPALLLELSFMYYEQLSEEKRIVTNTIPEVSVSTKINYQCSNCMTIYDEDYGDPENNISSGVAFNDLPSDYSCPLCGDSKDKYVKME